MGAKQQIVRVIGDICDTGDSGESMEEIMQLERVTVTSSTMSLEPVTDAPVVEICRRMQWCGISDWIGYRVEQAPRQIVVCDKYVSFVINVQSGYRGPKPNA